MTFVQAVQSAFNRAGDFKGRSARSEYWWFVVACMLLSVVAVIVDAATKSDFGSMSGGPPTGSGLATLILSIVLLVPTTAVLFRRLHDTGRSAWWLLIAAVPLIGGLALLYFLVQRGVAGPNRFGADPLEGQALESASPAVPPRSSSDFLDHAVTPPSSNSAQGAANASGSIIEALERLAKLREAGVLTQQEFEAQKAQLLRG